MVRIDNPSQLAKGLRVKLTHPKPWYDITPSNPTIGSQFECEGKIIGFEDDGRLINVVWDNGCHNSYHLCTLSMTSGGKCVSIWEN